MDEQIGDNTTTLNWLCYRYPWLQDLLFEKDKRITELESRNGYEVAAEWRDRCKVAEKKVEKLEEVIAALNSEASNADQDYERVLGENRQLRERVGELEATAKTVAKALRSGPIHDDYQSWCGHLAELLARKEDSQ